MIVQTEISNFVQRFLNSATLGALSEAAPAVPLLVLLVEFVDELLEDERVDVLAELVEEEPVAEPALSADAGAGLEEDLPEAAGEHGDEPVDDLDPGHHGHDDEPEPEEDVDLLVDDVEREDAEAVELLDLVTLGKTLDMGSVRSSSAISVMAMTSEPYWVNSPPMK